MNARLCPAIWLSLILASCDKPKETTPETQEKTAALKVTKSARPTTEEIQATRSRIRNAVQKASEISSPEERNKALAAAIWDAVEADPVQARQDLQKLAAGSEERNGLIAHLAMRLAEDDVDDAVRWASSLESEEEKSLALGKVALVISEDDPAKAANLLSDSGVASRDFGVSVVQVVQRWAAQSPADAAAWVVLFDPGEVRSAAIKEIISAWAIDDTKAAAAWISNNPDEKIRREGIDAMSQVILDQPDTIRGPLLESATPEMKAGFEKLKAEAAAADGDK